MFEVQVRKISYMILHLPSSCIWLLPYLPYTLLQTRVQVASFKPVIKCLCLMSGTLYITPYNTPYSTSYVSKIYLEDDVSEPPTERFLQTRDQGLVLDVPVLIILLLAVLLTSIFTFL